MSPIREGEWRKEEQEQIYFILFQLTTTRVHHTIQLNNNIAPAVSAVHSMYV